ncbi:hypothetical protein HBB16_10350 [Pseudonocardia sp. MCCB 268]|nr:hypothetical protein [Pseudonocardia cytotoxica]
MALVDGPTSFYDAALPARRGGGDFFWRRAHYLRQWFGQQEFARVLAGDVRVRSRRQRAERADLDLDPGDAGLAVGVVRHQAVPAVVLAVVVLRYLPDRVEDARWLLHRA